MCLAIPAKITEISDNNIATVDILGAQRSLRLTWYPKQG